MCKTSQLHGEKYFSSENLKFMGEKSGLMKGMERITFMELILSPSWVSNDYHPIQGSIDYSTGIAYHYFSQTFNEMKHLTFMGE